MNILVLNAGSSSLRFQLIRTDEQRMAGDSDERLAKGYIARIGGEAVLDLQAGTAPVSRRVLPIRDHRQALEAMMEWLIDPESGVPIGGLGDIAAGGHRGGHAGPACR